MNMEFNPFKKWFGDKQPAEEKTSVEEIFPQDISLGDKGDSFAQTEKFQKESRERKIRDIQLPPDVDEKNVKNLIASLEKAYKDLHKKPDSLDFQTKVVEIQDKIREAFGNSAEAEVLLANIDIDIEASLRKGTIDNTIYKTYQKLGDLNVYEKILKGKTPEWIDRYLPTLSKMAARSVSVRTAISAVVVAGGGIVGGVIALPWLSVAVAAGIGGAAGFYALRTLYKSRKEKEYFEDIGKIAFLVAERKGIDNLSPLEIKESAEQLLNGAHHLGKAVGLKEDGSVDTESIAAQVLTRYDKLLQEAGLTGTNVFESDRENAFKKAMNGISELYSKYDKQPPLETFKNSEDLEKLGKKAQEDFITSDMFLTVYKQELERTENNGIKYDAECVRRTSLYIAEYVSKQQYEEYAKKPFSVPGLGPEIADEEFLKYKVNKRIEDRITGVRRQGLKDLLKSVRDERLKEAKWGIGGFLGGAVASTLIRSLIYFGTHGETIQDWWQKHVPGGKGGVGAEFSVGATRIQTVGGRPHGSIPPPAAGPIELSPMEEQGKVTPGFPGETDIKPVAPVGTLVSEAAQPISAERIPSLDNTTLADQYNFLYGEHGSEPKSVERLLGLFKKQGIDFAQGVDGKTPDTLIAKVGEGLSKEDTAEDHILMQFLGKIMKGTVHDTFVKNDIRGFPPEEKGALLNFMYNLRNDGLLSLDKNAGVVTLKYDPEELATEYDEWSRGHDWDIAKADDYAKEISSERWNRWFGFEEGETKGAEGIQESPLKRGAVKHVSAPTHEKGVYELDSKEHLTAEKGLVTNKNITEAEKRLEAYGARKVVQPGMPNLPAVVAPDVSIGSTQNISAEAVSVVAIDSAAAPSGVAIESAGVKAVVPGAAESIAEEAVHAQGAGASSVKVETAGGAPKAALQSMEELTPEKRLDDVLNVLRKEYGIPKKFVKEIEGSFSVKHFMASVSAMLEHAKHTVPGELSYFQETGNVSDTLKNKFAEELLEKDFSLGRELTGVDYHNLAQLQTFLEDKNPTTAQRELVLKDFLLK